MRVILRDFAARGLPQPGQRVGAETLWNFIGAELKLSRLEACLPDLQAWLGQRDERGNPRGLLLLDGLDEVPEANQRREQLKAVVEDFAKAHACRIVVTSRTYAYQKQAWQLQGFERAVLAAFSRGQIERFVDSWYAHVAELRNKNLADQQARAELLKRAILTNKRLYVLAERPLLLTLMASLHAWRGGSLPEKREELYADAVDLLLDRWESDRIVRKEDGSIDQEKTQPSLGEWLKVDRERVRRKLEELTYEAHRDQVELTDTADLSEDRLVGELMRLSERQHNPAQLVEYLSHRAGLLLPRGVGVYTFPHRTFQEYLAACYLTNRNPKELARLAQNDPNRWREVTLLAGARLASGGTFAIWPLVTALCNKAVTEASEAGAWGGLLAGQILAETGELSIEDEDEQQVVERIKGWLLHGMTQPDLLPAVDRALVGEVLAQLGDPREEVMTVDAMQFCYVPAGPFMMGSVETNNEKPVHEVDLDYDYWIGRYPVTVAQFSEFVADSGHKPRDGDSLRDPQNQPVRYVTWYEGRDFCQWLTEERWRDQLPAGWRVLLPSEAEWEKAARGGLEIPAEAVVGAIGEIGHLEMMANPEPERRYPWGDEADPNRANYDDTGLGRPNVVGCFAGGRTVYGCEEMSGNVFEWTRSLYEFEYPYDPKDGREDETRGTDVPRVLRGGAFYSIGGGVRCAVRDLNSPGYRSIHYGFRVTLVASR